MDEHEPSIQRSAKSVLAGFLGLVIGLLGGLIVGLLVLGFGDAALLTAGATGILLAVLCFRWPAPVLTLSGIVLSAIGVES